MDLNRLYFDHQLLLMKARRTLSAEARRTHEACASLIAGRMGGMQRALGAAGAPRPGKRWLPIGTIRQAVPRSTSLVTRRERQSRMDRYQAARDRGGPPCSPAAIGGDLTWTR